MTTGHERDADLLLWVGLGGLAALLALVFEHVTGAYQPSQSTGVWMGKPTATAVLVGAFAAALVGGWETGTRGALLLGAAFTGAAALITLVGLFTYLELVWGDFAQAMIDFTAPTLREMGRDEAYIERFTALQRANWQNRKIVTTRVAQVLLVGAVATAVGAAGWGLGRWAWRKVGGAGAPA